MNRFCGRGGGPGRSPGAVRAKTLGLVLMGLGTLVMLLFVPCWVWTSVLAVVMISIGFLIWRFN